MAWEAARVFCQDLGGDLAMFRDANAFAEVLKYVKSSGKFVFFYTRLQVSVFFFLLRLLYNLNAEIPKTVALIATVKIRLCIVITMVNIMRILTFCTYWYKHSNFIPYNDNKLISDSL